MIRLLDTILAFVIIATLFGALLTPVWLMVWHNPWDQLRRSRAEGFYRWAMMIGSRIDWDNFPQIENAHIQDANIVNAHIYSHLRSPHDPPSDPQP